jgi:hypothetical protein
MSTLRWLGLVVRPLAALTHTQGGEGLGCSSSVHYPMFELDHTRDG